MAVSRATQLQAHYRAELRRNRTARPRQRLRMATAFGLVRMGLRIAGPLTVELLLGSCQVRAISAGLSRTGCLDDRKLP